MTGPSANRIERRAALAAGLARFSGRCSGLLYALQRLNTASKHLAQVIRCRYKIRALFRVSVHLPDRFENAIRHPVKDDIQSPAR